MPTYDFACASCATRFEELVKPGETPPCPSCGSKRVRRLLAAPAPPPKFGLRGGDARRSEAERRARRERRQEGRGNR